MPDSPDTPERPSLLEVYRLIRSQIEHEDGLISQRLSWFIMSQSFLFTAFAITVANARPAPAGALDITVPRLSLLAFIPLVAIASSLLIGVSLVAAVLALRNLRRHFRATPGADGGHGLPPIHGAGATRVLGLIAPLLLPPLFLGVWTFLLVISYP
jgi:hypothetical protein